MMAVDSRVETSLPDIVLPEQAAAKPRRSLEWIEVAEGAPCFVTESGTPFAPIGQNDAITWPDFAPLFRRRDINHVRGHLAWLAGHGVTVLRLMLEYAQVRNKRFRFIERPLGRFVPNMVQLWDDLFALCEEYGIRILLTPYDTFWTWLHWRWHPYNRLNGGPLDRPSRLLLCRETRQAIKDRLSFAVERWGGSGALFAWDLWNEIHPAHGGDSAEAFGEFIHDLADHVTRLEMRLYGRTHPKTVSLFGPELTWRSHMPLAEEIFRHPDLDFASIHIYETGAIDDPRDTVAAALATGRIVRGALAEITDTRPFFDSEHGPIHRFKDHRVTLPAPFDDEYFRHMQWAHFASGGAGGGMRWPNRHPHVLTHGMRRAQRSLQDFTPLIGWQRFRRTNLNEEVRVNAPGVAAFACGDGGQAVVWLLRTDTIGPDGRLRPDAPPVAPMLRVPGLAPGPYSVTAWDTTGGRRLASLDAAVADDGLTVQLMPFAADVALAITRR